MLVKKGVVPILEMSLENLEKSIVHFEEVIFSLYKFPTLTRTSLQQVNKNQGYVVPMFGVDSLSLHNLYSSRQLAVSRFLDSIS